MPDYGLLSTGFVPKSLEVIRDEINTELRTTFGDSLDLTDGSLIGQFIGIIAEREALLWELGEAINSSQDPDNATGTGLDSLSALTGTLREQATPSTVVLTLTGTPGTIVASGSKSSVTVTEDEFETTDDATIATTTAWVINTAYVIDNRRTNSGRVYVCITSGTSAGSGGPSTTSDDITDNTAHWRYIGEGTGNVDVDAECTETGPTIALSGNINEIETPISGWESVLNLLDATAGSDEETDEDLRVRRELELEGPGVSTADAIRADILDVEDVTAVTVFYNDTDVTDGDGIPPHAVEVLVRGGEDQDIFDALLASVAAGIATYGTESGTADDAQGTSHAIEFTRPDEIEIYVDVVVIKDADLYPSDGDTQIKEAIVAWGDAQNTGKDAVSSAVIAQCFQVAGVLDVTDVDIGTAPAPAAGTTIAIGLRELAVYDTSRITVASSDGTP